uniref:MYND-type domain-containing protein n=1 Tax=Heligmosomoides polygyrus TaxID=6339 RepID=A0A8L8KMQ3_HELPZ
LLEIRLARTELLWKGCAGHGGVLGDREMLSAQRLSQTSKKTTVQCCAKRNEVRAWHRKECMHKQEFQLRSCGRTCTHASDSQFGPEDDVRGEAPQDRRLSCHSSSLRRPM